MIARAQYYRIGVDVGGTNTDAALAATAHEPQGGPTNPTIIASTKSPTTSDLTTGICSAIEKLIRKTNIANNNILSVNIGTTHFINAIVQADQQKLVKVAVLRLCGPFCREVSPFADFPPGLKRVVQGHVGYLSGGIELDGRLIKDIDEEEVKAHARQIASDGIQAVVVNGVFANFDPAPINQEHRVRQILEREIPGIDVVCSCDISNGGYLERENASILNAAILSFGRQTITQFEKAIVSLGIDCPLYLTQNDGTVLDAYSASVAPIRTFSSGATNSLIGAVFLANIDGVNKRAKLKDAQIIMCDIGGTTSDLAALSPAGLPRPSPSVVKIGGVRTAFNMPEVTSIGLGGGSIVRASADSNEVTVGPRSVGHRLKVDSKCFGGSILTATDIAVATSGCEAVSGSMISADEIPESVVHQAREHIRKQIDSSIDAIKVSDKPVILLLVGGGSVILTESLSDAVVCVRPPFADAANAVGAAIAKVSGEVDTIVVPDAESYESIKSSVSSQAIHAAIKNGASPGSVKLMELDLVPLQYTNTGAVRVTAKAVGDLGWERWDKVPPRRSIVVSRGRERGCRSDSDKIDDNSTISSPQVSGDTASYRPHVSKTTKEWFISATDLMFIAEGTGILGTGGGGSVYTAYLNSLQALESCPRGAMRVIDSSSLPPDSKVASIAYVGAPSASNERLTGENELLFACNALAKYESIKQFSGMIAGEIGGSNGMRTFSTAAAMNIPIVDGDTIGRAFPRVDMSLPYVYDAASPVPAVISDARGNTQIIAGVDSAARFENLARAVSVELGSFAAMAMMLQEDVTRKYCCQRSLSQAWYLGRAICTARSSKLSILDSLIHEVPGLRKLYSGKVIDVSRSVQGGWTIGTVTLTPDDVLSDTETTREQAQSNMVLQYQNEFLWAGLRRSDSSTEVLCITPDLISVLDMDGTAIGTHELRYGLRLVVVAMPADPLWKTPAGMKAGGPKAFGLDIEYKEFGGEWQEPRSVIEEFGV